MLELRLRHWLKDVCGDDCEWVEPGRGISVGIGDAWIKLPRDGKLSVELKIWQQTQKGLRCDMRPSQIRYHYMSWHRGLAKTAILFALEKDIFVVAGRYVPKDKYKHVVADKMVHVCSIETKNKANLFRSFIRAFNKDGEA